MQRRASATRAVAALLATTAALAACGSPGVAATIDPRANFTDSTPEPLTAVRASIDVGRAIFGDRAAGNCVLCHRITGLDVPFQGDVGPELTGVGQRLTPAQLRYRIVDASRLNPATIMPPYYRTDGLNHVAEEYRGRTVLTAEQVEHLVAYLASLQAAPQ